jgi:adenylate cyclase class IV
VKFHLDSLEGIGNFVEIEAGNKILDVGKEKLYEQCDFYMKEFGIKEEELLNVSYSDMVNAREF